MHSFIEIIIWLLQRLIAILQKRLKQSEGQQNTPINTLAPKILTEESDVERIRPYLESFKQAIDTNGINNIAITGSYGSGKSTIIKTFQNQNQQYKYLNISLASFTDNKEDSSEREQFERKLEISILQQMFYHVKPSVIPDSRFKRIVNVTGTKLLGLSIFLILWIFSALILLKFGYIEKLNPIDWKISSPVNWAAFLSSITFFAGIGLFVKSIYRLFSNSKINKLTIRGELELGEAVDKSVFNQHLEEILYFFERTEFNVVVIEDVDRFNSTDIFTKLREINILVNNSKLIERPVKFIYAIKDEMFKNKNDRVKFFEFIIPIVPFINPSNANDQLAKLVTTANLQGVLSSDFTSDIVTFIDDIDMRLLINIFQEYRIYSNILSPSLKQDNLFAILVYKNMYPDDFGELSKRRGKLYKFLTAKPDYVKDLKKELSLQIENIDKQINLLESEVSKPIKELRAVYINKIVSRLENFHSFYKNKNISITEAVDNDYFEEIKNNTTIKYVRYDRYYSNEFRLSGHIDSNLKLTDIEKEVSTSLTYLQREKLLVDKKNNQIDVLKIDREKLRNKILEIEALSIQEIFTMVNISNYLGEFKDSYLMRNLLLNGHIDEHFDDYISLFHEISLTKDDFIFERNVKGGISLQFDYQLNKTENLIKKLPEKYFKREAIFNYFILESLLDNEIKFSAKLDAFYKGLSIVGDKQFQFIYGFINSNPKEIALFIKKLCASKPGWWTYIYTKSGLPNDEIRNLIRLIFEYADINDISKFEDVKSLVKYFEEITDLFAYCASFKNINNIKLFISKQKIQFKSLDLPVAEQQQFFEFIYTKDYYEINAHNILNIIRGKGFKYSDEKINSAHYTTILKLDLKHLNEYININIEDYISNVMLSLEGNTNEAEETIVDILNREDVELDLKEKVLVSQETLIQSISSIDEIEVQQLAISKNKIVPRWMNVFDYYDIVDGDDFDEYIVAFLNDAVNYEVLSKEQLNENSDRDEEYIKKMAGKLLHCKDLSIDAFTSLLESLPYVYNRLSYENFETERIDKLLFKKILTLTPENFNGLKAKSSSLSKRLIEIHQDMFIEKFPELTMQANDWVLVFTSSGVTQKNKLLLIEKIDDSIIINNSDVASAVGAVLPVAKPITLRYEVLEAIFKANNSNQKKIGLLNLYLPKLDDSKVQILTEKLGEDYAKIFTNQENVQFPNSEYNIELFNNLKDRHLIKEYKLKDKKTTISVVPKGISE